MPTITIAGTIIEFPDSAASPNWAPPIIEFAQAVEGALEGVAGEFDVTPQSFVIDAYNPGTNIQIPVLNFPPSDVKATYIRYTVIRETSTTTAVEAGQLTLVYNPDGIPTTMWEVARESVGPGAEITFNVTDLGQVRFSTSTLTGINHTGTITFEAKSLLQGS